MSFKIESKISRINIETIRMNYDNAIEIGVGVWWSYEGMCV